ncbi:MAG: flippase [Nanoarchaeota archaeon]|nr:flippase [Nanoarchaeota archaeon]
MSNYTKRAIKGSMIVLIMNLLAAVVAYATRMILARSLTVTEFGLFYAVFSLLGFLLVFKDLGMSQAMLRFIPRLEVRKKRSDIKTYITTASAVQLISSGAIAIVLILISGFLAENYFHNSKAKWVLIILAIGYWISSLDNLLGIIFQGFQRFFIYTLHNLIRNIIILSMIIIFLFLGYNVLAPSLANLFVFFITILIFGFVFVKYVFKDYFKHKFKVSSKSFKHLMWFGIPSTFMVLGQSLILYTDSVTITYFIDLNAVALYNVAIPIATLILYVAHSLGAVLFPFSSELWAKKQIQTLRHGIKLIHKYVLAIIIPLALTVFVFPEIVINIFFGQNYIGAAPALQILSIGIIIYTIAHLNICMLLAIGKPRTNMWIILSAAILNLILNIILIQFFGIIGAALATSICYLIIFILSNAYLNKLVQVKFDIKNIIKFFFAGVIFVLIIDAIKRYLVLHYLIELSICIIIGLIVYCLIIFILKAVSMHEILDMKKKFFKK